MAVYICLGVWTLVCVWCGFWMGRTRETRREQASVSQNETDRERDFADAVASLSPTMRKQWENVINYDGTRKGQQELNGDE